MAVVGRSRVVRNHAMKGNGETDCFDEKNRLRVGRCDNRFR